jgi:hypothetical protein
MDAAERDSTQDWLLPGHSAPPLLSELELRIDEALATAQASEAAVMTVGAAALDAAEQARRAARLAERASAAALGVQERMTSSSAAAPLREDDSLRGFSERADRVIARLRELERPPLRAPSTRGAADLPRSAR